jgi:2-iminobutanoate/2-iminopropanoate deaminase
MRQTKLRTQILFTAFLLATTLISQSQIRSVTSPQSQSDRFSSPAVDAGGYVYISGQGPQGPDGKVPATFDAQVRQTLDKIKAIVLAAGLTMNNVVYTQVYLTDISKYDEMNRVFGEYFPKSPPARAVLGVAGVPQSSSIEINAVAVRDLSDRRAISAPNTKSNDSA